MRSNPYSMLEDSAEIEISNSVIDNNTWSLNNNERRISRDKAIDCDNDIISGMSKILCKGKIISASYSNNKTSKSKTCDVESMVIDKVTAHNNDQISKIDIDKHSAENSNDEKINKCMIECK